MTYGSYCFGNEIWNLNTTTTNEMWYVLDIAFDFDKYWLAIWKEWNVDRMKCDMFLKLPIWWNIYQLKKQVYMIFAIICTDVKVSCLTDLKEKTYYIKQNFCK